MKKANIPISMLTANLKLTLFYLFSQRYIHPIILHVVNGVALCGWMILLYFFTNNYVIITVSMGMSYFPTSFMNIYEF